MPADAEGARADSRKEYGVAASGDPAVKSSASEAEDTYKW